VTRFARLLKPLDDFFRIEAASGLALLAAAAVALIWANSGWHATYERIWDAPLYAGGLSLHYLINDGLMAVFFLVVGLEIRREMHDGALSTLAQATLPLVAAAGGILAPALVYEMFAASVSSDGWAIPTATDIAFAVGMLALLGRRVDPALRALLLAIAIADDVAAVLIIAFFYADGIAYAGLALAAAGAAGAWIGHRIGLNIWVASAVPGAVVWYGLAQAGIHPALAGVAIGLLAPMGGRDDDDRAERLEAALHPWVAFGVMPLFALANAGVRVAGLDLGDAGSQRLAGGIALGLLLGKPLGIAVASLVAVRSGLCRLPPGVAPGEILVIGCLGGIGFTMSIFIAALAFADPTYLAVAKFGVLSGSAGAAVAGLVLGRLLLRAGRAGR
jgi:NhaA family Na+:H+ antiporter